MLNVLYSIVLILLILNHSGRVFAIEQGFEHNVEYVMRFRQAGIASNVAQEYVNMNEQLRQRGRFEILGIDDEISSERFLCFLPGIQTVGRHTKKKISSSEEKNQREITRRRIFASALKILSRTFSRGLCIHTYGLEDSYWTYMYCFGDKIIQFHENIQVFLATHEHIPENPDFVYVLGRFPGNSKKEVLVENQSDWKSNKLNASDFTLIDEPNIHIPNHRGMSIQHTLYDGETCDITGVPREITVTYICDKNYQGVRLLSLRELKTCVYHMVIAVPGLCFMDEFLNTKNKDEVMDIVCNYIEPKNADDPLLLSVEGFLNLPEKKGTPLRICYQDYKFVPCGGGFFLAYPRLKKNVFSTEEEKIIYTGTLSIHELAPKLAEILEYSIGTKIYSPVVGDDGYQQFLSEEDIFIMWHEIYDITGRFVGLSRIERTQDKQDLDVQIIDPFTYMNQRDEYVEPYINVDGSMWKFEKFQRP